MLVMAAGMVRAQGGRQEKKELLLHFRFDRSLVDSGYRNNAATLRALHELLADSFRTARIDSVSIRAYSSPDGNGIYNQRLATHRAKAVKGYLVWKYPHLDQYRIRTSAGVENWDGLLTFIENAPDMPCKEQVMKILGSHARNEAKEARLKAVGGGAAYRYIQKHILPELRNASVCTVWMKQAKQECLVTRETSTTPLFIEEGQGVVVASPLLRGAGGMLSYTPTDAEDNIPLNPLSRGEKREKQPLLALKTNLLFDAALMPNAELEVPIRKHFSLNGELMFPWWLFKGDKYCMQILAGGLEGRYWLGNRTKREVLTGHFLGLYAGGGKYDLQWDRNGYQGEFFIAAGLSYGYAMSIARNLHLEFSLGVGLLRTTYEHYHTRDNYQTLLWQNNGRYTWLGPTKAKVSLVWMLNRKAKKGGVR